jgi:hypothetical protein
LTKKPLLIFTFPTPEGSLERIPSSLISEWLRIINRLLTVENPEQAPRGLNKLKCVNGAKR